MRFALIVLASGLALSAAAVLPDIDVDKVLGDPEEYSKYFECLKGGDCATPEAKALRDVLPHAMATQCSDCSPDEKEGARKVIKFLLEKKPADYDVLEKKYDPEGITRAKFQKQK